MGSVMENVEQVILQELKEIREELRILNSKIDNFAGYFEMDEEELHELLDELEETKRSGVRLEEILDEL
ncbi:hypothetical protein [Thermococcus sp.]|uniref:hypothetical protein n=1 Tax=Thermococcus sp. TaxID=35749 RepID=UPI0025D9D8D9|nr:hypothetical protein [Thermococcus sp.]